MQISMRRYMASVRDATSYASRLMTPLPLTISPPLIGRASRRAGAARPIYFAAKRR